MAKKQCKICGKDGYLFYPYCYEHLKNRENKNDNNKKSEQKIDSNNDIEFINDSEECYICGEYAPYGKQCQDCYYETLDYMETMDKNRKAYEIRDYYYNLKQNIYRIKSINNKQSNCNKLIALALLCRNIHNDDSLISRVYKDIEDILTKSLSKNEQNEKDEIKNYDEQKNETSGQVKCIDGHWVENDLERQIDDILYSLRLPHVYAKRVNQITERTVKCDWFIPVLSDSRGIFIELWGMDTKDYIKNKEEKIKLYQEEELPLIQIYKKDVTSDISILKDNLESQINELTKDIKRKKQ